MFDPSTSPLIKLARAINAGHREIQEASKNIVEKACEIGQKLYRQTPKTHQNAFLDKLASGRCNTTKALIGSGDDGKHDSDEYYTPAYVVALVKKVFGGSIDLDPASCKQAQKTVGALQYFDKKQNGLKQKWLAPTAYLNCPYSAATKWMAKALAEFESGHVKQLVILSNGDSKTAWWHTLFAKCDAICFTKGCLKFRHPTKEVSGSPMGSHIFYIGPNAGKFVEVFSQIGRACLRTSRGLKS